MKTPGCSFIFKWEKQKYKLENKIIALQGDIIIFVASVDNSVMWKTRLNFTEGVRPARENQRKLSDVETSFFQFIFEAWKQIYHRFIHFMLWTFMKIRLKNNLGLMEVIKLCHLKSWLPSPVTVRDETPFTSASASGLTLIVSKLKYW